MKVDNLVNQQIVGKAELQELNGLHDIILLEHLFLNIGLIVLNFQFFNNLIQLT